MMASFLSLKSLLSGRPLPSNHLKFDSGSLTVGSRKRSRCYIWVMFLDQTGSTCGGVVGYWHYHKVNMALTCLPSQSVRSGESDNLALHMISHYLRQTVLQSTYIFCSPTRILLLEDIEPKLVDQYCIAQRSDQTSDCAPIEDSIRLWN